MSGSRIYMVEVKTDIYPDGLVVAAFSSLHKAEVYALGLKGIKDWSIRNVERSECSVPVDIVQVGDYVPLAK
jgi:hypothetical protein